MEQKYTESGSRDTIPCDRCLNQFVATRHQLHQQIARWRSDYEMMQAENQRLRARLDDMVAHEIRLRLDMRDAQERPAQVRLSPLGQRLRDGVEREQSKGEPA